MFNSLKEKGLQHFDDPQNRLEMFLCGSGATSTDYVQPRLGGVMAAVLDHDSIARHCAGYADWRLVVEVISGHKIQA